jgi:hypothetical protein
VSVNCCQILTNTGMCQPILIKLPSIKLNKNPFTGSRAVTCGHTDTDRHGEANRHMFHCCTNVIRAVTVAQQCVLTMIVGHSSTCDPRSLCNNGTVFQQWPLFPLLLKNATDMDGTLRCCSLSLEREEHLNIKANVIAYA